MLPRNFGLVVGGAAMVLGLWVGSQMLPELYRYLHIRRM
jgi:hypothetical protein